MKPHPLLLSLLMLGAVILDTQAQAQTSTPPTSTSTQDKKSKPRADAPLPQRGGTFTLAAPSEKTATLGVNHDGSVLLILNPGPLESIAKQLEALSPEMANKGSEPWAHMPNLVFGPGTQEAEVPTIMRLRQVTPVQALALVAAAAGCTLEPISAPMEPGTSQTPAPADPFATSGSSGGDYKIIGYRFELVEKPKPATRNPLLSLVTSNSFTPKQYALKTTASGVTVPFAVEPAPAQKSETPASKPPPISLNMDVAPTSTGSDSAAKTDEPSVRVYALGPILRGTPEELQEKQAQLQDLVQSGLNLGALAGKDGPNLSFHTGTKTLIVKASAAQHDVISQIITALKENEAANSLGK